MGVVCHDVVEKILERVPVKSLLRFKSVSKQWKSTIESNNFKKSQMIHHQQSRGPDVLFLTYPFCYYQYDATNYIPSSLSFSVVVDDDDDDDNIKIISSSPFTTVKFPSKKTFRSSNSCDGLVCLYNKYENIVINPTTRWHRTFPLSNLQQRRPESVTDELGFASTFGFGKDKYNGTYKSVFLYRNTRDFNGLRYVTTCEVFDFSINAWRYVSLAQPYIIFAYIETVNIDGSLHWLTKRELGIEVLSFDLHTETFQVVAEAPLDKAVEIRHYKMCNLNNRLCVSQVNWPNQVMWLFDSRSKTWNQVHAIDMKRTVSWFTKSTAHERKWEFGNWISSLEPLAILEEKNAKMKVLFSFNTYKGPSHLLIYDGETYELAFTFNHFVRPVSYFQSLISIL